MKLVRSPIGLWRVWKFCCPWFVPDSLTLRKLPSSNCRKVGMPDVLLLRHFLIPPLFTSFETWQTWPMRVTPDKPKSKGDKTIQSSLVSAVSVLRGHAIATLRVYDYTKIANRHSLSISLRGLRYRNELLQWESILPWRKFKGQNDLGQQD